MFPWLFHMSTLWQRLEDMIKVYEYSGCSTCKSALKALDAQGVAYERIPIVERPPTRAELKRMLEGQGGDLKRLLNTSGQLYREMELSKKLPDLSVEQVLDLLSKHGKLIKRPFVLGTAGKGEHPVALVGFKKPEWVKAKLIR